MPGMFLDELRSRRHEIAALGRRFGARRIRIFGSVARGEDGAGSDVDFLVDLPYGYDLFAQRLALADELAALCRRPVDVVPEHELNRHLRESVLREAVEL
jgi:predicted nucleotidyltransferase